MSIDSFKNEKIIMSFFLNYFIALTFDKVVNVRITLAKTISKIIIKKGKNLSFFFYKFFSTNFQIYKI